MTWLRLLFERVFAGRTPSPEELGYTLGHSYVDGMERPDGRERLSPVKKAGEHE